LSHLDVVSLDPPARLIMNPRAGQKLGVSTNDADVDAVQAALQAVGIDVLLQPTERPKHATELAQAAVRDGCKLVIAAGGDGTVAEVGEGLVNTETALGIMPRGSIMNMARTLCIPRDMHRAAAVIAAGQVLAMDVGQVGRAHYFEAGGVGLAAALFGYFERVDKGRTRLRAALRGALRYIRHVGTPRLRLEIDGERSDVRAAMVAVSNGPFVGAAYALAPHARVDDGLLDVVVFSGAGVARVLFHLILIAGGRRLPPPPEAHVTRARTVTVQSRGRRRLPVHSDGSVVGSTPAQFEVLPAALHVLVGDPEPGAACAWERDPAG